jgi:hypothetical protein
MYECAHNSYFTSSLDFEMPARIPFVSVSYAMVDVGAVTRYSKSKEKKMLNYPATLVLDDVMSKYILQCLGTG